MKRLFGADGIRGVIDQYPFQAEDQVRLGQALAHWWQDRVHRPVVLLGTDTRESNQRIKEPLVDGLTRAGVDVWDIGIIPTAAISFLVASNPDLTGGLIVSASHNPILENGLKVFDQRGMKITDQQEALIEDIFFSPEFPGFLNKPTQADVFQVDALADQYIQGMVNEFEGVRWRQNKILVDCANGAAYRTVPAILDRLEVHYRLYNAVPDGTNINSDVGSEFIRKLPRHFANELQKNGAELGIAFDGDADRVVFVDRDGLFYDGDMLLAIVALALKERNMLQGSQVVITQMSNSGLAEHLHKHGIQTRMVRNGDKYITDVLVADDLTLGGEQIGHLVIRTDAWHVTGDGLRTALWILDILARNPDVTLRDLMRDLRKWPQINVSVGLGERMFSKAETIPGLDDLKQNVFEKVEDLSHFECRPASTEPVYRIMLEAKNTSVPVLAQHALGLARHIQKSLNKLGEPVEILDCVTGGMVEIGSCFPE